MPTIVSIMVAALLGVATAAAPAAAQHCHIDPGPPTAPTAAEPALSVAVGTRLIAGVARVDDLTTATMIDRSYQGGELVVDVGWRRLTGEARLGAYRVDQQGVGLSDLATSLAARVTPRRWPVAVLVSAGATWPTGDADAGRGMGHVMVAAGATARLHRDRATAEVTATYARALGDGSAHAAHAHGAELWPLIDPMGPEEVSVELAGALGLGRTGLATRASGLWAEPVGHHGARRLIATGGLEYAGRRYLVGAALGAPVLGDPFLARGQLRFTYVY